MAAGEYVLTVTSGSESVSYDLTVPAAGTSSVVVSDGGKNTSAGTNALASNTTGKHNTAVGFAALENNTEGDRNTASGSVAMRDNITGADNTAIGKGALKANLSGNQNTAIGRGSLRTSETGNNNIAIGDDAGSTIVGDDNITIGNVGEAGDTATTRIGTEGVQTRAFMAGIKDVDQSAGDPVFVGVDGQLGIGDVLEGPQGPQGKIGPQGDQGPQGKIGAQGDQGPQGKIGPQGDQGDQGPQGKVGTQGDQGPQGKVGSQGEQGVQGKIGPQGIQGTPGVNCWEAVAEGETVADCIGDDGPQGPQGKIGPQGDPGPTGASCSLSLCAEVEETSHGYGEATLTCGETLMQVPCVVLPPTVFVTSESYNGNLGGLAGADAKCQTRADSTKLGGTWLAWLSTDSFNAITRLQDAGALGPYVRTDGVVVAEDLADLTDGELNAPIDKDEYGIDNGMLIVWTGTTQSGLAHGHPMMCNNWTVASGG